MKTRWFTIAAGGCTLLFCTLAPAQDKQNKPQTAQSASLHETAPSESARGEKPSQIRRGGTQRRTDAKQRDPKNQRAAPTACGNSVIARKDADRVTLSIVERVERIEICVE